MKTKEMSGTPHFPRILGFPHFLRLYGRFPSLCAVAERVRSVARRLFASRAVFRLAALSACFILPLSFSSASSARMNGVDVGMNGGNGTFNPVNRSLVIALQTDLPSSSEVRFTNDTRIFLETRLIGLDFVVRKMTGEEILSAAEARTVDFALTGPAEYAALERFCGAKALVSHLPHGAATADVATAGALVVRADAAHHTFDALYARRSGDSFGDLTIETPDENYFPALALRRELSAGAPSRPVANLRTEVKNTTIWESSEDRNLRVVREVKEGDRIAALLPACAYEALPESLRGAVKVLSSPASGTSSPCQVSTPFYPGAAFSSFLSNEEMNRLLAASLLSMPATAEDGSWRPAVRYDNVQELLATLRPPLWNRFERIDWKAFVAEHRVWFAGVALALLALLIHTVRAEVLVRRRTEELVRTMEEKSLAEEREKHSLERIAALERIGVVGELSSVLAHDLKNPLAVIHNYARGIERLLKADASLERDTLKRVIRSIDEQSVKASSMVDHVRNYAKQRQRVTSVLNFSALLSDEVNHFAERAGIALDRTIRDDLYVESSELELRLVFKNLLRNAREAMENQSWPPYVTVTLDVAESAEDAKSEVNVDADVDSDAAVHAEQSKRLQLVVEDNGPRLSDEDFERLSTPLCSKKPEGLGLGLVIVRRIVEADGGHLRFERNPDRGLRTILQWPLRSTRPLKTFQSSQSRSQKKFSEVSNAGSIAGANAEANPLNSTSSPTSNPSKDFSP